MPRQLVQKINETDPMEVSVVARTNIPTFRFLICVRFPTFQLNTVWVSCEGENPADIENVGPIEYYPRQGFPGYYYPYENSEGYLSPLVAIHFKSPMRKSSDRCVRNRCLTHSEKKTFFFSLLQAALSSMSNVKHGLTT